MIKQLYLLLKNILLNILNYYAWISDDGDSLKNLQKGLISVTIVKELQGKKYKKLSNDFNNDLKNY